MNKIELLVPAALVTNPTKLTIATANKAVASMDIAPQPDLLFMRSVLVSTGQNKNDDVFLPEEMWKARSTPLLKPVDWEHNTGRELTAAELEENPGKVVVDNQTIGVMYNAYAIDENGQRIDENLASASDFEIPRDFHIVDEAVIWKSLYPTVAKRIEDGTENGTLFVSMEAWFTDYNYLVGNKVVARNEETAFLDAYLRANGGNGVYSNSRVGRVLKDITFGGKGIVARPANDPSVIMDVSHEPISAKASIDKVVAKNIICDLTELNTQASQPREDSEMSDVKNNGLPIELYTEAKDEAAGLKAEMKTRDAELAKASENIGALEAELENVKSAFTKGAELLDGVLPGFSSRVTEGNPENFFSVLAELLETNSVAKAELESKLTEALASIEQIKLAQRTAAREAKLDALLGLAEDMSDDEKKKAEDKKKKMMAAVDGLGDEQFDSLYEVWAEHQAEAMKHKAAKEEAEAKTEETEAAKKPPMKDEKKKDESCASTAEVDMDALVAAVVAKMGEGGKTAGSFRDELVKSGHSVDSVDDALKAIAGFQEPTDEDNMMIILDSVKASESTPPAGEESHGVDLSQSMGGVVGLLLGRKDENN